MRNRMLLVGSALIALAVATPALANPITIDKTGPCYNAAVNGKNVLPHDACYIGPPPSRVP